MQDKKTIPGQRPNPGKTQKYDNAIESISWTALEFVPQDRPLWWFIVFFLAAGGLIAFGIYSKSIMTTILFSLLAVVTFGFAVKKPRRLGHILSAEGITIGRKLLPYREIRKFWLHYNPPMVKTLNIETTASVNNTFTLQLENQDPVAVKRFLKKYLPEDLEREETIADAIARKIKF